MHQLQALINLALKFTTRITFLTSMPAVCKRFICQFNGPKLWTSMTYWRASRCNRGWNQNVGDAILEVLQCEVPILLILHTRSWQLEKLNCRPILQLLQSRPEVGWLCNQKRRQVYVNAWANSSWCPGHRAGQAEDIRTWEALQTSHPRPAEAQAKVQKIKIPSTLRHSYRIVDTRVFAELSNIS